MKRIIALFAVALVAFLFAGCEKERHPEYYVLWFSARVVDAEGNPIQGICAYPEGAEFEAAKRTYVKKFPYAAVAELHLWLLRPQTLKLTDNTLGFGRKLIWKADE